MLRRLANGRTKLRRLANGRTMLRRLANGRTKLRRLANGRIKLRRLANGRTKLRRLANGRTKLRRLANGRTKLRWLANSRTKLRRLANSRTKLRRLANSRTKNGIFLLQKILGSGTKTTEIYKQNYIVNRPDSHGVSRTVQVDGLGYGSEHCSVQLVLAPSLECRYISGMYHTAEHMYHTRRLSVQCYAWTQY